MKTRLLLLWDYLRSSYWFLPSLMAGVAVALSAVMVQLDATLGAEAVRSLGLISWNEPEGARELLGVVAAAMIGVAGVTFSITIVSVVYASGSFGPRVLTNFMADRGNQLTLGTFIATYVYCLMVLRTVRANGDGVAGDQFVPHLSIVVALALAGASIAVLIYFIHHVPRSIHVSHLVAEIGLQLEAQIDRVYPDAAEPGASTTVLSRDQSMFEAATRVESLDSGYIQSIDEEGLLGCAENLGKPIRVLRKPGDFVSPGDLIAEIAGQADDDAVVSVAGAFSLGQIRTALQDVRFLANELVEIAIRALSPGINDPFTAIACIDWLSSSLKLFCVRQGEPPERRTDDGDLRLVMPVTTFEQFASGALEMLGPHARNEPSVWKHLLLRVRQVLERTYLPERRSVLEHYLACAADPDDDSSREA